MSGPMERFATVSSAWAARAAGSIVFLTAFLICGDVLGRFLVDRPVKGTFDLTGYMLAISTAWSFAYAHVQRANIRVDIAYARFPRRARAVLDIAAAASVVVMAFMLTCYAYETFEGTFRRGSRVPFSVGLHLWYFQAAWLAGLLFFSAVSLLVLLLGLRALFGGRLDALRVLIGIKSMDDEVTDALRAASNIRQTRT
ncbi:TRAP transporter small permease [Tistrella bauzanensis]|uniref:TRAP transporter small permease protein n=1 Tax=Tistrella arctica TaxID=3133430 RepID=A0ABU9YHT2_9PROT